MLSGETAVGKYPVESVQTMSEIALATESHLDQDFHMKKRRFRETQDVSSAVAFSSVATAMNVNAKYILCSSMSGQTARVVSKFHPECPIIGLSPIDTTLRKMQMYWGVIPMKTPHVSHSEEILNVAVDTVKDARLVEEDDVVVITAGSVYGKYSITNIMKVFII
jgi:pyruvate kinase